MRKIAFRQVGWSFLSVILLFLMFSQRILSSTNAPGDELPAAINLPSLQVNETVYVCAEDCDNRNLDTGPIGYDFDTAAGTAYSHQVLANEWHTQSQTQALLAGAVSVYTFSKRNANGCGAIATWRTVNGGSYRVLDNCSQRYWLGTANDEYSCYVEQGQNTITNAHRNAVANTRYQTITRLNFQLACAKHFTDCGDPTATCVVYNNCSPGDDDNLISISDPVDNDSLDVQRPGMSQNGSHAWELSNYDRAAPWDYRQILTHYYSNVKLQNAHNDYRWVWLDVTPDIKFSAYTEDYHGPVSNIPSVMQVNQDYSIPIHIKNTGLIPWVAGGSQPVYLSYHWYDSSGNTQIVWDGERTSLGQDMPPGADIILNAHVRTPSQPGTYVLKWDMVKEYVTWFSWQQDWPTQDITVQVKYFNERIFLPGVLK